MSMLSEQFVDCAELFTEDWNAASWYDKGGKAAGYSPKPQKSSY
jgi:hypothetical protein